MLDLKYFIDKFKFNKVTRPSQNIQFAQINMQKPFDLNRYPHVTRF
jgi:hypothetical protein